MAVPTIGEPVRTVVNLTPPVSDAEAAEANGYPDGMTVAEQKRDKVVAKGGNLEQATDTGALYANDYQTRVEEE